MRHREVACNLVIQLSLIVKCVHFDSLIIISNFDINLRYLNMLILYLNSVKFSITIFLTKGTYKESSIQLVQEIFPLSEMLRWVFNLLKSKIQKLNIIQFKQIYILKLLINSIHVFLTVLLFILLVSLLIVLQFIILFVLLIVLLVILMVVYHFVSLVFLVIRSGGWI